MLFAFLSFSTSPCLAQLDVSVQPGRVPFSTGMKVRLGLAMALLTDPSLLLLDEPQNGLDPAGINQLRALIQHLTKKLRRL
ncbi:AAA family ATPase [Corynebacterium pseudopelargi]|uniref:AAA family ATPase n=1 Tax=Corynebacterium pseudopelargi TaxID=2080757 RepID=UPI003CCC835C